MMKRISRISALFIYTLFISLPLTSCEEEPINISGDSALQIINNCTFSVKVYFDDDYIGKVEKEENESWSVPSGTHEVKATSVSAKAYTQEYNFPSGGKIIMTLSSSFVISADGEPVLFDSGLLEKDNCGQSTKE